MPALTRAPQRRIEHKVSRKHLHTRGVYEHAGTNGTQYALCDFRAYAASSVSRVEHDEAGEDTGGRGERKEEREERAEPVEAGLLGVRGEGGDADAEREALEELVEGYGSCERLKVRA